jgi:hypothetical protein
MKTVSQRNLEVLGGQAFLVKAPVTLTFDLTINRDHFLILNNIHATYEDCGSKEL